MYGKQTEVFLTHPLMEFLKNKFVIVLIGAVLAGGATGLFLSKMKKTDAVPVVATNNVVAPTGSGANAKDVEEVIKKLNALTDETN